jgi:hypothetical protein
MEDEEVCMGADSAEEGGGHTHRVVHFRHMPPEDQYAYTVSDLEWYELGGEG